MEGRERKRERQREKDRRNVCARERNKAIRRKRERQVPHNVPPGKLEIIKNRSLSYMVRHWSGGRERVCVCVREREREREIE